MGKSYSLENSLRESIFREDLFLYNCLQATGAATAVRESSRSSSRQLPKRMRPPRLVLGPGGSLPVYGARDGRGQEMMYRMNGRDYGEIFVAHEQLRSGEDDLQGPIV